MDILGDTESTRNIFMLSIQKQIINENPEESKSPALITEIQVNYCFKGQIDATFLSTYKNLSSLIFLKPGQIKEIIGLPPTLKTLICTNQKLAVIPNTILNIEVLDLSDNCLETDCLENIRAFRCLKMLNLDNNKLSGRVDNLPSTIETLSLQNNKIEILDITNLIAIQEINTSGNLDIFQIITAAGSEQTTAMTGAGKTKTKNVDEAIKSFNRWLTKQNRYFTKCSKCNATDHNIRFWKTIDADHNIIWNAECPNFQAKINLGKTKSLHMCIRELETKHATLSRRIGMHEANKLFEYGPADRIQIAHDKDLLEGVDVADTLNKYEDELRDLYIYNNNDIQTKVYQDLFEISLDLKNIHSLTYNTPEEYSDAIATHMEKLIKERNKYSSTLYPPTISRWVSKRSTIIDDKEETQDIRSLPAYYTNSIMKPHTHLIVDTGADPVVMEWNEKKK